jgi:hypothetical protein
MMMLMMMTETSSKFKIQKQKEVFSHLPSKIFIFTLTFCSLLSFICS